jgi:PAS domain S-box-containing protein
MAAGRFGLKFFHRALILVVVPLLFELFFVSGLMKLIAQAEAEARKEEHAKQICLSTNVLMNSLLDGTKLIATSLLLKQNDVLDKYHQISNPVEGEFEKLRNLIADNPNDLALVDRLEKLTRYAQHHLEKALGLFQNGDRIGCIFELKRLQPVMNTVSAELDTIKSSANKIVEEGPEIQTRSRQAIKSLLWGGLALNIFIALGLAAQFNRGVTSRLSRVVENSKLLADRESLLPVVPGGDEVAELDQMFHKMAENIALAHETERLTLENLPVALVMTDISGQIRQTNPFCHQIFQYSPRELDGKPIGALLDDANEVLPKAEQHYEEPIECKALRKDAHSFPAELSVTPLHTIAGERRLHVLTDLSQRKELERLKRAFVETVSCELRNPLSQIDSFLDAANNGEFGSLDENGKRLSVVAARNSKRLLMLVNDLLAVGQIGSVGVDLRRELIQVSYFIERSVELIKPLAEKHGLTVVWERSCDEQVYADGDRLVQVMVNLLGNAIKFSPAGGVVRVTVESAAQWLTVKIGDQGRGIPPELKDSIFERFKQVTVTDATEKKGSGLGLAICKAFVEQHGGTIGVDSELGKGSTFWFKLPGGTAVPEVISEGQASQWA